MKILMVVGIAAVVAMVVGLVGGTDAEVIGFGTLAGLAVLGPFRDGADR